MRNLLCIINKIALIICQLYCFRCNTLKVKIDNKLKELNAFGLANQEIYNAISANISDIDVNKTMFTRIARPKLADNRHTIWEIPVFIDC